jgi:thiamine-monophosphate kinase
VAPATEFELIAKIRERLGEAAGRGGDGADGRVVVGSGDDAAVTVAVGATVTSVDAAVEGVHFRRDTASLRSIGHKALAAALSDLAAMGADAGEAYVQLAVPEDVDDAGCLELAGGLGELASRVGVRVIGGDLVRSPVLVIAITVVGYLDSPGAAVRRSGARPGDVLVVTGELGGAGGGLLVIERPELAEGLAVSIAEGLRRRQLEPEPRLPAGRALAASGAKAMIDISDGLGADAGHVAAASRARLAVELDRLPLQKGVAEVAAAAGLDPFDLATAAGEDYELLAAIPPEAVESAVEACASTGVALTPIGAVTSGEGVALRDPSGHERPTSGFDQRRSLRAAGQRS